jgi:4-hydroxy-3-polyprenylbenzoate decarboxylase
MQSFNKHDNRVILAVTGASGMPYAEALVRALTILGGVELHIIVSKAAARVLEVESDTTLEDLTAPAQAVWGENDIAAPPASGSWLNRGMIICPCSMATLGKVANGIGDNLINRAADVCLKERRPLILVTRETPFNRTHLDNMLKAHDAGATIMPASPSFYLRPASIWEMTSQFAGRVLDCLGLHLAPSGRWGD